MSLKIIFAGTPDFSVPTLQALIDSKHNVLAVLTKPDAHSGRGQHTHRTPVKKCAEHHNLPVLQPHTLKDEQIRSELTAFNADVMVVVVYGLILPASVLAIPKYGCLNVHASILPRWRGAAPIHHALLNGDQTSGISIMQMAQGLDTGDILATHEAPITDTTTCGELYEQLAQDGAQMMLSVLDDVAQSNLNPIKQDDQLATYANKITKLDAQIDWSQSAQQIDRMVRAFNPWPVAFTHVNEQQLRIWQATIVDQSPTGVPGNIMAVHKESIDVATGDGVLRILSVQLPGARRMSMQDVLNSKADWFQVGTVLC